MNTTFNEFELNALAHPHGRIAVLLSRYPHVAGREVDEIVAFIKSARPVDIGRLSAIDAIRPRLVRFIEDNKHRMAPSLAELVWVALAMLILAIGWTFWDKDSDPLLRPVDGISIMAEVPRAAPDRNMK